MSAILSENAELENKLTNLQEEINKLTAESTDWESKFYDMQDNFHNANEEIERLKEENILLKASEPMSKIAEDYGYKSRCKKAIEYINERKHLNWYTEGVFVEELLNILGGEE